MPDSVDIPTPSQRRWSSTSLHAPRAIIPSALPSTPPHAVGPRRRTLRSVSLPAIPRIGERHMSSEPTILHVIARPGRDFQVLRSLVETLPRSTSAKAMMIMTRVTTPSFLMHPWGLPSAPDTLPALLPQHDGIAGASAMSLGHLQPGDLLKFPRRFYDHWAMYLGERDGVYYVIHLWSADEELSMKHARVCVTPLHHVPNWETMSVSNSWDQRYAPFHGQEAVDRAVRRLGRRGYNVVFNNCEHFVTWARHGAKISDQVHAKTAPPAAALGAAAGATFCSTLLPLHPAVLAGPLGAGLLGCAAVFLTKGLLRRSIHVTQRWINNRRSAEELLQRQQQRASKAVTLASNPPAYSAVPAEAPPEQQPLCWTLFRSNTAWDGRRKGLPEQPPWVLVSTITRANKATTQHLMHHQ